MKINRPNRLNLGILAMCLSLSLILSLSACGTPSASGPADTFGLDFSMPASAKLESGGIVFFVDGLNAEIFDEMLQAGELPAIKKYFVDRGLYAPRATANTPSVTLANLTSFVTGAMPGHHGVVGINWFDRNRLIWRNYETIAQKNTLDGDYIHPTIYEQFPGRDTFSIFFQPHRNATKFVENWTSAGPPFYFGWYEFVDRLTLHRFNIVNDIARKRGNLPAITIAYMLAPDFRAYDQGVGSQAYRDAIRHTDYQIGRVLGDIERAGLLDKLYIVLISDHGLGEVTDHFPIEKALRDRIGLDIADKHLWEETPFEKRLDYYSRFPAVLYGSGDRYWALCLRKPLGGGGYAPWTTRPSAEDLRNYPTGNNPDGMDLVRFLADLPQVDVVAHAAGENRVRVVRQNGQVEFAQPDGRGGKISYRLIEGDDPLGWKQAVPAEMLNGKPASGREWLKATSRTNYPDLPEQIVAYFRAKRAGDIAVFATDGWDFRNSNRAGHGGLNPSDMHVPLIIAGPGIQPRTVEHARAIDVMPTLLELLGRKIPPTVDGQSLIADDSK